MLPGMYLWKEGLSLSNEYAYVREVERIEEVWALGWDPRKFLKFVCPTAIWSIVLCLRERFILKVRHKCELVMIWLNCGTWGDLPLQDIPNS